jgi:hypothetical protein
MRIVLTIDRGSSLETLLMWPVVRWLNLIKNFVQPFIKKSYPNKHQQNQQGKIVN